MTEPDTVSLERYKAAAQRRQHHAQIVWQVFGAFLISHAVLLGFVLRVVAEIGNPSTAFFPAFAGSAMALIWFAASARLWDYYELYMAQEREAEPPGWNLMIKSDDFRAGKPVSVDGKVIPRSWAGTWMRTRRASSLLIVAFEAAYIAVLVVAGISWTAPGSLDGSAY